MKQESGATYLGFASCLWQQDWVSSTKPYCVNTLLVFCMGFCISPIFWASHRDLLFWITFSKTLVQLTSRDNNESFSWSEGGGISWAEDFRAKFSQACWHTTMTLCKTGSSPNSASQLRHRLTVCVATMPVHFSIVSWHLDDSVNMKLMPQIIKSFSPASGVRVFCQHLWN